MAIERDAIEGRSAFEAKSKSVPEVTEGMDRNDGPGLGFDIATNHVVISAKVSRRSSSVKLASG